MAKELAERNESDVRDFNYLKNNGLISEDGLIKAYNDEVSASVFVMADIDGDVSFGINTANEGIVPITVKEDGRFVHNTEFGNRTKPVILCNAVKPVKPLAVYIPDGSCLKESYELLKRIREGFKY